MHLPAKGSRYGEGLDFHENKRGTFGEGGQACSGEGSGSDEGQTARSAITMQRQVRQGPGHFAQRPWHMGYLSTGSSGPYVDANLRIE
jgi:hypothetical protein